ncbi:MAG: NIPSNAP family protein [Planctomycetaceae bacterium]|nr:NIPSNAP family protein [Planctomycetaceae bacterium]
MRKNMISVLALLVCGVACTNSIGFAEEEDTTVYELRTYTCHPGRLSALHKRFRDHTMKLFKKHGMTNVMYWTPVDKEDTLVYVLKHDSREAAKKSWDGFRNDPEWQKVFKESHEDGKIVMKVQSVFLKTTDYSPTPTKE